MNIRGILKKVIYSFIFLVLFVVVVGPWGLYWLGLYAVDERPALPSVIADVEAQKLAWSEARGEGEPKVNPITPYGYIYLVFNDRRPYPDLSVSWLVAANHNRENKKFKGNLWWHLSGAALTIWITRNWSTEQILSKVIELKQKQNG